ncbi:MAG: PmoA family protein [Spirochaetales bacterium]|jgi:hypothetical protein|nr:PmoA family protein [Spirochaetales bacterium]
MMLRKLTVQAEHHDRHQCPVEMEIEIPDDAILDNLVLRDDTNGRVIPHQMRNVEGMQKIMWMIEELPAGWERGYELRMIETPSVSMVDGVDVADSGSALSFYVGGSDFTSYNYSSEIVRPYFYPLYSLPGIGITRNWPMVPDAENETNDHPHHKGLYTAQGEVNGVDNWGEEEGHGYQVHCRFDETFKGPVAGGFTERLEWTDKDRKPNMAEKRQVTIYNSYMGLRIIDYDVTLSAEFGDVTLGDTKEAGLLSVRVATSMDAARPDGGKILNGYGALSEAETWGKQAPWCDYSGPVQDGWCGICMMDHPDNPCHPTYWHVRDYGLMTANCFGVHHFTANSENRQDLRIAAGDSMTWRYRVIVHSGRGEHARLSRLYHDFANPPNIVEDEYDR